MRNVAVIDIGKTNAKVALVDLGTLSEIDIRRTSNHVDRDGLYPHLDIGRLWIFILESLRELSEAHGVDAISITTHGATAALLDRDGELALPILDYEHNGPDETRAAYTAVRPDFAETGSPALPVGLNIGTQLFWQQRQFPEAFAKVAAIVMYPQYWAYQLTGQLANEVTSLGCHTDLWNPTKADYSSLVDRMGWRPLFAPVKPANTLLGPVLPDLAVRMGLQPGTPVACGIHDSNASLLPHVLANTPPFSVVSTGTWVVCMAMGGKPVDLDPARDTLVNVNALGQPVPSSRFMGGREYEMLGGASMAAYAAKDIASVIDREIVLLPSVQTGCGPYPERVSEWRGPEATLGERAVAISFYLALMTATCLDLIGADGDIIVEGPFAGNAAYLNMLAAATGRPVVTAVGQSTGTSAGAALLIGRPALDMSGGMRLVTTDERLRDYAARWRAASTSL